ncbi:MAG: hypothetical protein IJW63_06600 [Lachnospiraceae bacterium]|nr:hypothetical protein [Lachnospiraceae bacterium]
MSECMSELATIEDLVQALYSKGGRSEYEPKSQGNNVSSGNEFLAAAYEAGWIEQLDMLHPTKPIFRRDVAKIVHLYLCHVLGEPDETEITPSYILKDLYDCRVCAGHIMQVYLKGIMESIEFLPGLFIFGLREHLTKTEITTIVERVFWPNKRLQITKRLNH